MKTKLLLFFAIILGISSHAQIVHLTGAGVGGWNNPPLAQNLMSTTDNVIYTLSNVQITGSGGSAEFKFMVNSDWGTTYGYVGTNIWPSGTAGSTTTGAGTNIPGVAGFWNVTFNITSREYAFTPGVNPNATINITSSGSPITMVTTDGINYSAPSSTLAAGGFTFSQAGSSNQWGNAAFPSGTATPGGSPVNVPGGTFNITFNKNSGAYNFANTSVAMIGQGSPSGDWGVDAVMNTTDAITYTLNNAVIVGGSMKIRDNGSWTYQFGCNGAANTNTFPSATVIPNGNDFLTQSGTYNITFNRTNGVLNFADVLSVNSFAKNNFKVFPNPTNDNWNFSSVNDSITSIQIVNVLGKVVLTSEVSSTDVVVDASNLTSGIYFASIASATAIETIKLVKN